AWAASPSQPLPPGSTSRRTHPRRMTQRSRSTLGQLVSLGLHANRTAAAFPTSTSSFPSLARKSSFAISCSVAFLVLSFLCSLSDTFMPYPPLLVTFMRLRGVGLLLSVLQ